MRSRTPLILAFVAALCAPHAGSARVVFSNTYLSEMSPTTIRVDYNAIAMTDAGTQDPAAGVNATSTTWQNYFTPWSTDTAHGFNGYAGNTYFPGTPLTNKCYTADTTSTAVYINPSANRSGYSRADGEVCREKPPIEKPPLDNCPIVLDLDRNGLNLSGAANAVRFDIDADGIPNELGWTRRQSDDAFLCLDRNNNGTIDDGTELFGYATPLASGEPAVVGFNALAELDANHDGVVSAADPVWARLCVWRDTNRDGTSQASEISALSSTSVLSIGTSYTTTPTSDAYGNLYRYLGWSTMRGPGNSTVQWPAYDVILQEASH